MPSSGRPAAGLIRFYPWVTFSPHFLSSSEKYPRVNRRKQKHWKASAERPQSTKAGTGAQRPLHVDTPAALPPQQLHDPCAPDMEQTGVTLHPGMVSSSPTPLQGLPSGQVAPKGPRASSRDPAPSNSLTVTFPSLTQDGHPKTLVLAQGLTLVKTLHGALISFWNHLSGDHPPTTPQARRGHKPGNISQVFSSSLLLSAPAHPSRTETTVRNA